MRFRKIGIKDVGIENFVNDNYSQILKGIDTPYQLLEFLIDKGLSDAAIGRIYYNRTAQSVKVWRKEYMKNRIKAKVDNV